MPAYPEHIMLNLAKGTKDRVTKAAAGHGVTMSEWCRMVVLHALKEAERLEARR